MSKSSNVTNQLNDPVFGKMEYKHSWHRPQSVNWWNNQDLTVKITAHAYTGSGITEQQREAFSEYLQEIDSVINNSLSILNEYLQSSFDIDYSQEEIFTHLTPRTVLFFENSSWGILFDADMDIEHGIALYKKDEKWKAGPQDDFL